MPLLTPGNFPLHRGGEGIVFFARRALPSALAAVALCLAFSCPLSAAEEEAASENAQPDASTMSFSQLLGETNKFLGAGDLMAARPLIEELIERFEPFEKDDENIDLATPTLTMAQANVAAYQKSGDKALLAEALKWYERFISKYPTHERITEALDAQAAIMAEAGRLDEAAAIMVRLLSPPLLSRLAPGRQAVILQNLVRLHYSRENFQEGLAWFEKLAQMEAADIDARAYGAAAAFDAHLAASRLDQAMSFIPILSKNTEIRFSPRLNIAFLKASDQLVATGRYGDAALVLGLTITTPEMAAHHTERKRLLERRIANIEQSGGDSDPIAGLKSEADAAQRMLDALAKLPPLTTDLLIRKARNYMQTSRTSEAFWLFYRLMKENPDDPQAEFLTYAAMANANSLGKTSTVHEIGLAYLKRFPDGQYLEDTILLMLPYYRENDKTQFLEYAKRFLDTYPDNQNAPDVLAQYARQLIDDSLFSRLDKELEAIDRKNPDSYLTDSIHYWLGMSALMNKNYKDAIPKFKTIIDNYPTSIYAAEAHFRIGVAYFGIEQFGPSATALLRFVDVFSDNQNLDQAFYFLAQIAKIEGDPAKAADYYLRAIQATDDPGMVDIATFELADTLIASGRFDEAVTRLDDYIAGGADRDHSSALFRLGQAHEGRRDMKAALDAYFKGIERFAADTSDAGVDEILLDVAPMVTRSRDLLARSITFLERLLKEQNFLRVLVTDRAELFDFFYNNPDIDAQIYDLFRNDARFSSSLLTDPGPLRSLLETRRASLAHLESTNVTAFLNRRIGMARQSGDFLTELRLGMALKAADTPFAPSRPVKKTDLADLTPATLFFAGQAALDSGDSATARAAWEALTASDALDHNTINAHFALAKLDADADDLDGAIAHYRRVHEDFASSAEAPVAILLEAELEARRKAFDKARKLYEGILRVPNWRGPLHARALYEIGRTFEAEERLGEARGFYERVYLGYSHFAEWAGKSYLADASILLKMNNPADARRVLDEATDKLGGDAPQELMKSIRELAAKI